MVYATVFVKHVKQENVMSPLLLGCACMLCIARATERYERAGVGSPGDNFKIIVRISQRKHLL